MHRTIAFLALALTLFGLPALAQPASAGRMPAMTAYDLNGRELRVPQDLSGAPALWIVAFERDQQPEIDRVFKLIGRARVPGLVAWEVPVIEDPGAMVRFIIDQGMKSGIPAQATRARVVTLYVADRAKFLRAAGLRGTDAVAAAVAPDGRVLAWRPITGLKDVAALKALLDAKP